MGISPYASLLFFDFEQLPEDPLREPDVSHYLIEDAKSKNFSKESFRWLSGDSLLVIIAGRY
jgi:hypothetical protein